AYSYSLSRLVVGMRVLISARSPLLGRPPLRFCAMRITLHEDQRTWNRTRRRVAPCKAGNVPTHILPVHPAGKPDQLRRSAAALLPSGAACWRYLSRKDGVHAGIHGIHDGPGDGGAAASDRH